MEDSHRAISCRPYISGQSRLTIDPSSFNRHRDLFLNLNPSGNRASDSF